MEKEQLKKMLERTREKTTAIMDAVNALDDDDKLTGMVICIATLDEDAKIYVNIGQVGNPVLIATAAKKLSESKEVNRTKEEAMDFLLENIATRIE